MCTNIFAEYYVKEEVKTWEREIERLSLYTETQPHVHACTHILESKWSYLLRVTTWNRLSLTNLLQPLESVIQNRFILHVAISR